MADLRELLAADGRDHFVATGEDFHWLIEQTIQWPIRVHPERTTSDSFLRLSLAATALALEADNARLRKALESIERYDVGLQALIEDGKDTPENRADYFQRQVERRRRNARTALEG